MPLMNPTVLMNNACIMDLRCTNGIEVMIIFVFLIGGMKNEIFLDTSVKNTNMFAKYLG
jgi:hypothetical protein